MKLAAAVVATLLLVCSLGTLVWVEFLNIRSGNAIQAFDKEYESGGSRKWRYALESREAVARMLARDENGEPISEPYDAKLEKAIRSQIERNIARNRLYRVMTTWGAAVYPACVVGAILFGVAMIQLRKGKGIYLCAVGVLACCGVLARCVWLGILSKGLLA